MFSYMFLYLCFHIFSKYCRKELKWFPKDVIQAHMPPSFRALFPACRCVVDCSEVFIEKPPKQEQNILCYSNYKSHMTAKFFVATAPSG